MNYSFEVRADKKDRNGLVPIRIVIHQGKIRIRKTIRGVKTLVEDWDNVNLLIKNPKKNSNYNNYSRANIKIQEAKTKIETIFKFFEYNNIEFNETIFNERFKENKLNVSVDFMESFQEFIDISRLTKTNSTVKKYITTKNFLLDFYSYSKFPLRFDTITTKFEEVFMDYCFNQRETLNNYYGKLVAVIKTFMQWSFDREYHNSIDFKRIKRIENEVEVIYLNMDELMRLYEYNFEKDSLNRSRDFFCFGCFTGLRHSDIYNLDKANISDDYIDLTLIKTKTINHRVYLNDFARAILNKYKGSMFEPIPKISS